MSRYLVIRNKKDGAVSIPDPRLSRVRRMKHRVYEWSKSLQGAGVVGDGSRLVMLTLTYREAHAWKVGHIREFMQGLRSALGKRILAYAWVAELMENGRVHYHVLLYVKRGTDVPMPDASGLWAHGSTRRESARHVFYIVKYSQKEASKIADVLSGDARYPRGLRMFAVWISPSVLSGVEAWVYRLSALPQWVRELALYSGDYILRKFRRVVGGGWHCDGEVFESPYAAEWWNPSESPVLKEAIAWG